MASPVGRAIGPSLALLVALVALVGPVADPASARTASRVTGWSTSAVTVAAGKTVVVPVRVRSGGRSWRRPVVLQHRRPGGTWQRLSRQRTGGDGRVRLRGAPRASGRLRVFVPATRSSAARVTVTRPVRVTAAAATQADQREAQVVRLVNEVRASGTRCGEEWFPPVPAVRSEARLASASRTYARKMAVHGFFAHQDPRTGAGPGDRATAAGYRWSRIGENIAAGYGTPAAVVEGWRTSVGHCRNMMGRWTHLGVGWHDAGGSARYDDYWVQLFGTPR